MNGIEDIREYHMYLISAYFDDMAAFRIRQYMNQVAKRTGNTFLLDNDVVQHITISAFQTKQENHVIKLLEQRAENLGIGTIQWVSPGVFFPHVIYLGLVLNEYLHTLSMNIYECLTEIEDITISPCYQPFSWLPHTTIGKMLTKEEMQEAFRVLQNQFGPFFGQITQIGLAKTNPYENLAVFELPALENS